MIIRCAIERQLERRRSVPCSEALRGLYIYPRLQLHGSLQQLVCKRDAKMGSEGSWFHSTPLPASYSTGCKRSLVVHVYKQNAVVLAQEVECTG